MAYQPELEKLERRYQEDPGRNFAQLAESYRKLGRLDDALDVLRAHLADRPNYVSGLVVLGRCLLDQQNDAEARETFERVLAVDGEHIIALKALGEIAERAQEIGVARGWYQRLLDIDPMNDDAAAALSRLPSESAIAEAAAGAPAEPVAHTPEPAEIAPSPWAEAAAGPAAPPPVEIAPVAWAEPAAEPAAPPVEIAPAAWAEPVAEAATPPPAEIAPAVWAEATAWVPPERTESAEALGAPAGVPDHAEAPDQAEGPEAAEEIQHEDFAPAEEIEVRTAEFAGDMTIERASSEYLAEAAELEPLPVERISEVDIPVEPLADEAGLAEEPFGESVGEAVSEPMAGDAATAAAAEQAEAPEPAPPEPAVLADDAMWIESEAETEPITLELPEGRSEADELVIEPFDESLGWDAGERISHQISSEDLAIAEQLHEETLEAPVEEILDSHEAAVPDAAEVGALDVAPVDGLEVAPAVVPDVAPVEGFETTQAVEGLTPPDELEPQEPDLVAEAPLVVDAAEVEAQEALRQQADRRASLVGLPVFVPEEEEPAPLVVEAEPEPVLTETMAELYARQGLTAEARDVYHKLLEAHPGDPRLTARLAELEAPERPIAQPTIRYLAVESGGQRARDLLADVLSAGGAPATMPRSDTDVGLDLAPGPEPMDEAFEEEPGEIKGQPTQPAADEVSLAAIFGDSAPTPPPSGEEPEAQGGGERAPGGFSFDDLFGKGGAQGSAEQARPARDTLADDEGDDAFRDWLKSLKS
jgi:tetratricopeptide (TPR) repeat protein